MYPATSLRVTRLQHGLKLAEVAARAGVSATRASYIERDPGIASANEIRALEVAIELLARELESVGGAA